MLDVFPGQFLSVSSRLWAPGHVCHYPANLSSSVSYLQVSQDVCNYGAFCREYTSTVPTNTVHAPGSRYCMVTLSCWLCLCHRPAVLTDLSNTYSLCYFAQSKGKRGNACTSTVAALTTTSSSSFLCFAPARADKVLPYLELCGIFLRDCLLLLGPFTVVVDLHRPQRSGNWAYAALLLASNWIPQLFLFNSQTSEESQCKPQHRHRERETEEGRKRERVGGALMRSWLSLTAWGEPRCFIKSSTSAVIRNINHVQDACSEHF